MTVLTQFIRRIRFGPPIVVVSGLPRSGTSMMMQMLAAGGLPPLTDGLRTADESNPEGYFELEVVKGLDKAPSAQADGLAWLANARGKAVKILTPLLQYLPETYNYRVILMLRPLGEVVTSQNAMLARAGEATDVVPADRVITQYETHLRKVRTLLASHACFETLTVRYGDVIADPRAQADRVSQFAGGGLAVDRMAAAVHERLYRNRTVEAPRAPARTDESR
jgi:hypothetical protein